MRRKAATAASSRRFNSSALWAITERFTEREVPYSSMKSVMGMASVASGLSPMGRPPCRSMVPITLSSMRPRRIFWPTGSTPGKSASAIEAPMTTTRAASSDSASL